MALDCSFSILFKLSFSCNKTSNSFFKDFNSSSFAIILIYCKIPINVICIF